MLKSSDVEKIMKAVDAAIDRAFDYSVEHGGVKLPPTNNLQEEAAAKMWLISRGLKRVKSKMTDAQKVAWDLSIFRDYEETGIQPGAGSSVVWSGNHFQVSCVVRKASASFDVLAARAKMTELKIPKAKIDAIIEAGEKARRPAHVFDVVPIQRPTTSGN